MSRVTFSMAAASAPSASSFSRCFCTVRKTEIAAEPVCLLSG